MSVVSLDAKHIPSLCAIGSMYKNRGMLQVSPSPCDLIRTQPQSGLTSVLHLACLASKLLWHQTSHSARHAQRLVKAALITHCSLRLSVRAGVSCCRKQWQHISKH